MRVPRSNAAAAVRRPLRAACVAAALTCAALGACGEGDAAEAAAPAGAAWGAANPRNDDPRLVRLRQAIEDRRLDLARTLAAQVGELAGDEAPLLRARMAVLAGDGLGALREVEAARALAPTSPRVNACAAEIYALLGRFESAAQELSAGVARAGETADLLRATGVVLILQPGGAAQGLAQLQAAYALDPTTPFLARPLSQACLLEGRRLLAQGRAADALRLAAQGVELDPEELDLRELEADCRAVLNDFDRALELLDELAAAGRDVVALQADVHQRAATFELVRGNRTRALDHYRLARALGMDDAGLGFGATLLADEAEAVIERGIARYEAQDLAGAERAFREALEVDPTHLAARNHLGVVLFRREDFGAAAAAWREVLDRATAAGVTLPEPVELNLARALKLSGADRDARAVLEEYLRTAADGPWAVEAEEMLRRL